MIEGLHDLARYMEARNEQHAFGSIVRLMFWLDMAYAIPRCSFAFSFFYGALDWEQQEMGEQTTAHFNLQRMRKKLTKHTQDTWVRNSKEL